MLRPTSRTQEPRDEPVVNARARKTVVFRTRTMGERAAVRTAQSEVAVVPAAASIYPLGNGDRERQQEDHADGCANVHEAWRQWLDRIDQTEKRPQAECRAGDRRSESSCRRPRWAIQRHALTLARLAVGRTLLVRSVLHAFRRTVVLRDACRPSSGIRDRGPNPPMSTTHRVELCDRQRMGGDRPVYSASLGQAVKLFWTRYLVFTGRASLREFWWWLLVAVCVSLVLEVVRFVVVGATPTAWWADYSSGEVGGASLPGTLWSVVTLLPSLALGARRLHDTNRSGWWQLFSFVPVAGWVLLLVLCAQRPDPRGVRYDQVLPTLST